MKIYVVKGNQSKTKAHQLPVEESSTAILAFETRKEAEEFIYGADMTFHSWKNGDPVCGEDEAPLLAIYKSLSIEEVPFISDSTKLVNRLVRSAKADVEGRSR